MWLDLRKPSLKTQKLNSILYPLMKATLMHYPKIQNIWLWTARSAFSYNTVKPQGYTTGLLFPLRDINKTPWGTSLLLMAVLASLWIVCVYATY